ncbi:pentatricopeptide repeat-containing protein At5g55740, chloroplastic [Alnus glutinosa]|uniref:pentatricopeptide repeat-containing protein At5g55740, chloroplastic n=1 Tax=Alnus glutinosa TaxID=3517 RepID=UPI002D79F9A2|nr:pentatricopeptide repeat-containing protein At5g55740, chloroplastic [Alnus glutinosa]
MASLAVTTAPSPQFPPFKPSKATNSQKFTLSHLTKLQEDAKNHQILYKSYFHHISSLCKEGQVQEAVNLLNEMELRNLQVGPETYGELLQGCVYERALFTGQQIHARIVKNGDFFSRNEYIQTKLVIFYAKCDVPEAANRSFRRLRVQNVFSWAAIIGLHCRMGFREEALLGFCEMEESGVLPDNFVLPNALKACGALGWIGFGKGVHGYVVKMGFGGCVFVASSLVDMYGKCGIVEDARKMFDSIFERNVVAWNSMIVSYVQNGMSEEAIEVFYDMRVEGVEPTRVTVSSFLSASANIGALEEGKQGHAIAVLGGLELDNILGSSIINFYFKVGLIEDAELVFSRVLEKDVVTWNLLISGYAQFGQVDKALNMCRLMRLENLRFDSVTLASVLSASSDITNMKLGKEAHCCCIRNNLESDVVVASSIVDMYAKCERIDCARQVFNSTIKRDLVLWNTMLAAYAELGQSGEALKLFYQMQLESVLPNVISWNSVIFGFLRNGQVNEAKEMFLQMRSLSVEPNLITWTTLVSGMAKNGFAEEAILVFQQMQEAGIKPNSMCLVSALAACTDLAALRYGRLIHGYVTRHDILLSTPIATSLVEMYAKCGVIDEAKWVFDMILSKELPLYNAMICAYALHGQALEAIAIFKQLEEVGIEPDNITFTAVLSACSHAKLVNEGLELFNHMVFEMHMKPTMEHYGCVVNLLSRCGNFDDAFRLILTMPCKPDAHILGSLLYACRDCHEIELGDYLSKHLLELEPDNAGNYVALSNAYAASGRWDEVSYMRDLMKQKGLTKVPGCSWVQIGGELHVFVAGDNSHPKAGDIYTILALLGMEMHCTVNLPMFSDVEILCS